MKHVQQAKCVAAEEAAWVSRTMSPFDAETCKVLADLNPAIIWIVGEIRIEGDQLRSAGPRSKKRYSGYPSARVPLAWPDGHTAVGHTHLDDGWVKYEDGEGRLEIDVIPGTGIHASYSGPDEGRLYEAFARLSGPIGHLKVSEEEFWEQ